MLTISTLKQRADFVRLRRGSKSVSPYVILRAAPAAVGKTEQVRVGYTVTTKCGNAVTRNRIKRRLRALVREIFPTHARAGYDYVLIALNQAKPNAADIPFETLRAAITRAITQVHR